MSDPPLTDIDFKNKIASFWTILKMFMQSIKTAFLGENIKKHLNKILDCGTSWTIKQPTKEPSILKLKVNTGSSDRWTTLYLNF